MLLISKPNVTIKTLFFDILYLLLILPSLIIVCLVSRYNIA